MMLYTHAAAALIALAVGFMGAWKVQAGRIDAIQTEHARQALVAIEKAQAETLKLQEAKDEALRRANARASQNQIAADGARSELDRLRDAIAASDTAAPAGSPGTDAAITARELLGKCSKEYLGMAEKAQRHANDVRLLLDAWPK